MANMDEDWWAVWETTPPPSRDWESDWERELMGEVESDDDELKEDERPREPGMLTGAEPASNL